jgi:D-methionine transport system permease protein
MMEFSRWMSLIGEGLSETLYMTLVSTFFAYLFGLPLGVLLTVTSPSGIQPMPRLNRVLGVIINSLRSVPFLILLVAVLPLTRKLVGTTIGSTATIPPLVIAAAPFIARVVESSLLEVDAGLIEAAESMGASPYQIITKVLLTEARSSLATGAVIATTTILGYSALGSDCRQLRLSSLSDRCHALDGISSDRDRSDHSGGRHASLPANGCQAAQ